MKTLEYRGFTIKAGRSSGDYSVYFPATNRARWGTLAEICSDIDLVVGGIGLLPPKRGGN